MKVLLSAYACAPNSGTEPGNGWGWAQHLAARGLCVHVFTATDNEGPIREYVRSHGSSGVEFHFVRHPSIFRSAGTRYAAWQHVLLRAAREVHRRECFDVAHHVTYGSIHVPTRLWKLGIPVVFGPVGGGQTAPASMLRYFGGGKRKEQLRTAFTHFVGHSPFHRRWLRRMAIVLTSNRETLALAKRLGRDDAQLMFDTAIPDEFLAPAPRIFQKSSAPLKVLWVGRMLPRKAIGLTLDIFARVQAPATLTIVGDGLEPALIWKMVDERGLAGRVFWEGKRLPWDEVRKTYETHDVMLFNSLRESGGAQLLEAMAAGLPIVTLNLHGPGVLVPDEAGFKVEVCAPDQVVADAAKALNTYAGLSTPKRSRMAEIAWLFAQGQTYRSRAAAAEALYDQLIK